MKAVKLGDLTEPVTTCDPSVSFREPFRYVDIASVNRESKSLQSVALVEPGSAPSRARQLVCTGDVLVSTVRPNLNAVALVGDRYNGAIASTGFTVLRPRRSQLDSVYLFHWVRTPQFIAEMTRQSTGASYPAVSDDIVKNSTIPLPPLDQQKRIAAILDKADAIRRKRARAIQLADEFLRSLFLDMFGDPVGNAKRWPKSSFGEQLTLIQYGPRFYNAPYTKTGIRTVRITDLNVSGQLSFDQMPRIDASEHAVKSFSLTPGDMIFARSGATVGKTALIEEGDPPCLAGAYFLRMRFSPRVLPRYVRMVITASSIQKIISERSRQSAQQNFSGPAVRRLPLPLPPLELQQKFVQMENQTRAHLKNLSVQMLDVESLNSSLSLRAFRGEV